MTTPRGVRSIGEKQLQKNRALIFTNENKDELLTIWNQIPDGTLHVDPLTGVISQKLHGETSWVPYGVKPDNTLVISRDTQLNEESFVILSIDTTNDTFIYENSEGKKTHSICLNNGTEFVFILEKGSYMMGRNHLEIMLDDCLVRTVMSGGIEEISDLKFKVLDELVVGQKITVRYIKWVRIGNPYPRWFINVNQPESAEEGDFWLSNDYENIEDAQNFPLIVKWENIINKPTTLDGYGIKETYSKFGHTHKLNSIEGLEVFIPEKCYNAETVNGKKADNSAENLVVLDGGGKIKADMLPENYLHNSGGIIFSSKKPKNPKPNSLWVCTSTDNYHLEAYFENSWHEL